jgi:hypothetical protein
MNQATDHPLFGPGLLLGLLLLGGYAVSDMLPGREPPDGVDIERAMAHVEIVAAEPHPLGSDRNAFVRNYLVRQFSDLGLEVEVQNASLVYDHPLRPERHVRAASVENVLARLPGRESGPAVMVMSHYDSRPGGPGAGDAAAGVAAVLEAARILSAEPAPVRDVWFVLTDGEEMGLLGAQALFRQHPIRDQIGLVLNFEARGSAGVSMLFETGADNGELLTSMAEAITPVGTSMGYEVYRFMPNDTDLTISKGEGLVGLNFAFGDGFFDYHTEGDRPENLSPASLGGHVDQATRLARHFSQLPALPGASGNHTFFNPVPGVFLQYGPALTLMIMLLTAAASLVVLYRRREAWLKPWREWLRAMVACLLTVAIVGNLVQNLHGSLSGQAGFSEPRYWQLFHQYPTLMVAYGLLALAVACWLLAALVRGLKHWELTTIPLVMAALAFFAGLLSPAGILALVLIAALLWWYRRPLCGERVQLSALMIWLLLAGALQVLAPSASFVFALPLLWVAASRLLATHESVGRSAIALIVPIMIWAPMLYGLYMMLGVSMPQIPAIALTLVLLLTASSTVSMGSAVRGMPVAVLGIAGMILLVMAATANHWGKAPGKDPWAISSRPQLPRCGSGTWRPSTPIKWRLKYWRIEPRVIDDSCACWCTRRPAPSTSTGCSHPESAFMVRPLTAHRSPSLMIWAMTNGGAGGITDCQSKACAWT